jgi:hypothetical protein
MPGPVTSKYDNLYWMRLFAMLAAAVGAIYLGVALCVKDGTLIQNGLIVEIVLLMGCGMIYLLYFHKSPPRKIIISSENITIYEYITRKQTIIKYTDIDAIRTFSQSSDRGRSGQGSINFRILQMELYNGEIYRISENDYVNYDFLKNAIYDHLPNHRS